MIPFSFSYSHVISKLMDVERKAHNVKNPNTGKNVIIDTFAGGGPGGGSGGGPGGSVGGWVNGSHKSV